MQKFTLSIYFLCTLMVLGIGLSSCKDDDEPFVKPNLSVNTEAVTIAEGGGTTQVEIVLDKAAPTDITVEYSLGGTAISPADYSIVGTEGEVDIPQGETSATIQIQIVSDGVYEGNETIEISIEDVSSEDVVITNDDEAVVTITDDDPQITASMVAATVGTNEDDGELVLEVTLSGTAAQDITINYALTGTALDAVVGEEQDLPPQFWDYVIDVENAGELVIPQGATSGEIVVTVFTDFQFEDDETIIVTLNEASNGAQISTNNATTITVEQQNGKVLALIFDDEANTGVDMDLFLWDIGPDPDQLLGLSITPDVESQVEALIIPTIVDAGSFGASYTYWGGTKEPMEFEVHFADYADGAIEAVADREIYQGSYNLVNVNPWNEEAGSDPAIAQTFEKDGGNFVNISDPITVPASGSRMVTVALPKGLTKMKSNTTSLRQIK